MREDVPEEEDEDAGGERAQGGVEPGRGVVDSPEREPEEDRESRDRPEDDYLSSRQRLPFLPQAVRETLQGTTAARYRVPSTATTPAAGG
jgi:hypothetical protein